MQKPKLPLVINAGDVQRIYHCSSSTASRKLAEVRDALSKKKHQDVMLEEFCDYFGLKVSAVFSLLE